jgi:hypothetical protein
MEDCLIKIQLSGRLCSSRRSANKNTSLLAEVSKQDGGGQQVAAL